jgi:hypothetical protein
VVSIPLKVNLNLDDHAAMVEQLTKLGFEVDPEQVQRAMRQDGAFKGVAEHVFRRRSSFAAAIQFFHIRTSTCRTFFRLDSIPKFKRIFQIRQP